MRKVPSAAAPRLRAMHAGDQAVLWDILHVALWDPPPAPLRPREVLDSPGVRIYAQDWGRAGDVGVMAELPRTGTPVGACWLRLVPDGAGLAHVDDSTPQLGIAVLPPWQRQGIGRPMMLAALAAARVAGYRQVALTVHPQNPAIRMYASCGFRQAGLRNSYQLMVAVLAGDGAQPAAPELARLPNLGPASAAMLQAAGITTLEQLRTLGSVAAYEQVRRSGARVSLNLLWALEGALTAQPWQTVAREHRTSLLLALDGAGGGGTATGGRRPDRA